ncbi:quinon protein alcohol dehydrogenase-like superfamily [Hygrophoropsis aurantiaca]|uniref:Quinon protein alcohol dehydrogenase-like superfamily n=1 Tax=Hygrophoropsis aurantiaca TaxID=72124 RepID=A0ACB8A2D2_9AGAM|nr:quinon protein alcohol dehydrogenase-like superfamily [Hygrophoropsis aurantiaca]
MSTSASPELDNHPTSHLPTKVFKGHTEEVRSVAYFSDGKRMVSGSKDKSLRIWNVESGKQEGKNLEHDFEVDCIALSPDEQTLAMSTQDPLLAGGSAILWNLETRSVVWKTEEVDGWRVAFSPDGQLIAATAGNDIVLLNAETGQRIREALQFGDSYKLGVGCFLHWPMSTSASPELDNHPTSHLPTKVFKGHTEEVRSVAYFSDGKRMVSGSKDKSLRIRNVESGKQEDIGHEYSGPTTSWGQRYFMEFGDQECGVENRRGGWLAGGFFAGRAVDCSDGG